MLYIILGLIYLMLQEAYFALRVRKLWVKENKGGSGLLRRMGGNVSAGEFWAHSLILTLDDNHVIPLQYFTSFLLLCFAFS